MLGAEILDLNGPSKAEIAAIAPPLQDERVVVGRWALRRSGPDNARSHDYACQRGRLLERSRAKARGRAVMNGAAKRLRPSGFHP